MGFDNVDWIRRNTGHECTPDEARCVEVLCAIQRAYNLPLAGDRWNDVEWFGDGLIVHLFGELSTFDWDNLTRLVVAAHQRAVRVAVRPKLMTETDRDSFLSRRDPATGRWVETGEHPTYDAAVLVVQLNARQFVGSNYERHPDGDALAKMATTTNG